MEAEQLRVKTALVAAEGPHHNYKKKKAKKLPTIVTTPAFEMPEHQMDERLYRLDPFSTPEEYAERYRASSTSPQSRFFQADGDPTISRKSSSRSASVEWRIF
ncbi:hypothetical protein L596_028616 [Steinernema carpocapsae]|uniref:Uncharacterized protein n=1 Tax=Steinernema carpocapsae TaxID=34508 RepID=A0A4V5ZXX8_STECR|nr:hypothetical protein L596_028616 [Steinernema carpocapsae]